MAEKDATLQFELKGQLGLTWRNLAVLAIALGLWVSYRYAFTTWSGDADTSTPAVLWQGVRQHGPSFLTTWRYTPDSWLLWPLPLFFAAFPIVGDQPAVLIGLGWLIFVGCAAMAGLIVRRVAGWAPAAITAALVLLSNRNAIGGVGLFTYPLTHNSSMLAGLVAVYGAMRWIEGRRWPWLAMTVPALVVAGASDPWTQAAVTVPLGAAGAWLAWRDRRGNPRPGLALAVAAVVAFGVAKTQVFGLLRFVPQQPLNFVTEGRHLHAAYLAKLLAALLNILPGQGAPYPDLLPIGAMVLDLAILAAAALAAVAVIRRRLGEDERLDLVWVTGGVSCGVTAVAFVMLDFGLSPEMGRYFIATYIFAIMIAVLAADRTWPSLSRAARAVVVALGLALPVSGLISGWSVWTKASAPPESAGALDFARTLKAQGLTYGYGQYWDAQANVVTWRTKGEVTIRPVGFDPATGRIHPREAGSSRFWYDAADRPAGVKEVFLMIGGWNGADSDGCRDRAKCVAAAVQQFGPPVRQFPHGASTILVWDHPLFGFSPGQAAAVMAPVPLGQDLDLTASGAGGYILDEGWSSAEPQGTWTDATRATVRIRVASAPSGALRLTVMAGAFAPPPRTGQAVAVSLNGRRIAQWTVLAGDSKPYSADFPGELLRSGSGVLEFAIPGAVSPQAAKLSGDSRQLGINVKSLRLDPKT
jgi:hypothetical protein